MTRDEQVAWVSELSCAVGNALCQHIMDGRIPDRWGQVELMRLLADRFERNCRMTATEKRRYNRECMERGL